MAASDPFDLVLVENPDDVRGSVRAFAREAASNEDLARDLLRQAIYWVFDPDTGAFGPGKFVGFKEMTYQRYARGRMLVLEGAPFHGGVTRKAIERALGATFQDDPMMRNTLVDWGNRLLEGDVFQGIAETKWRFLSLPPKGR